MKLERDEKHIHISLSRQLFYGLLVLEVVVWIVVIGILGWGYLAKRELMELKEQNILHRRQVQMANEKLEKMESRLQQLDALDAEIRQMVSGAQAGAAPAGEGATMATLPQNKDSLTAGRLLARLSAWEINSEKRLISLSLLRLSLENGVDLTGAVTGRQYSRKTPSSIPSIWPTGGYISSPFGWRQSPFGEGMVFHEGIDIAGEYGAPIHATADGIVTVANWVDGYGCLVEVHHAGDLVTRYGHNSLITARVGDKVQTGDVIAFMGSTGRSTGSHLHYEVRVQGQAVDPMLFLPSGSPPSGMIRE